MGKMWEGRTSAKTDKAADSFNSSIGFDKRMFRQDITGSIAHAAMLSSKGIISKGEAEIITEGLFGILSDIESGALEIDLTCEDIHMFVEQELTARIGVAGKRLHTARSRNDQVALDTRMYLRDETDGIKSILMGLVNVICACAGKEKNTIMPGYTHMQRAQPVMLGHHLMAYAFMFCRDIDRFSDCRKRINVSPIGSCALAGTTYDTDRTFEAGLLGFEEICRNSLDGVSDRDFCIEFLSCAATLMMHLSRLSEELVLWSSWEFGFVEIADAYTTGSSIMPQKKNPDMAELIRGKTGRVYGSLMSILTVMKGLPLAYNKDMQEDKEGLFDAVDTVKTCVSLMTSMIESCVFKRDNMKNAAAKGFINATDLADYLVKKGMPFRSAYKISGEIVSECIEKGFVLETFPLSEYRKHSELFEEDVYRNIDLFVCAEKRISEGGTSPSSVLKQITFVKEKYNL